MTSLQLERDERRQQVITTVRVRDLAQQEALERLIALLDPQSASDPRLSMPMHRWDDTLHRQARLRAARASYALSTTDEMVRVSPGAWVRNRSRVS